MKCREFESALVELARHAPPSGDEYAGLSAHLGACENCRVEFSRQVRLSAVSEVLAAEAARFSVPASVEHTLLREITSLHRLRRRRIFYGVASGAIAAALAFAAWTTHRPAPRPPVIATAPGVPKVVAPVLTVAEQPAIQHRNRAAKPVPASQQPFIAIPYTLPLEPYERADVMRMDLPVAALIAVGLPMSMADPAALARADVLVGQDGRARAVRLISISTLN
jgi:hypothetical protein